MLWSNAFKCMIPHIDAQHQALFEHIERLGAMHGDVSRIPKTIEFLQTYTAEHFADEESLHAQTRYPQALEHQRQHQAFIRQIGKLREDYEASGHNLVTLMEMNHALVEWLSKHIIHVDKKFAEFYHALPEERKNALRLPHRPWIPAASQSFRRKATIVAGTSGSSAPESKAVAAGAGGSWTDAMLCGIPDIDAQHKELFRQVDILRSFGSRDRVNRVLRFLADYVVKHFNDEESLHLRSRYARAAEHKKLHEGFVKTFWELKAKYDQSEDSLQSVMEITRVVYAWLREHVLKVDKEFAQYYLARENGV